MSLASYFNNHLNGSLVVRWSTNYGDRGSTLSRQTPDKSSASALVKNNFSSVCKINC